MFRGALARSTHIRWGKGASPHWVAGLCPQSFLSHASLGIGKNRGLRFQLRFYIHKRNDPFPDSAKVFIWWY